MIIELLTNQTKMYIALYLGAIAKRDCKPLMSSKTTAISPNMANDTFCRGWTKFKTFKEPRGCSQT